MDVGRLQRDTAGAIGAEDLRNGQVIQPDIFIANVIAAIPFNRFIIKY